MIVINNNGKRDDKINLSNQNNGNNEIYNKNSNVIIICKKKQKVLKINKIVKSVCLRVIPYIDSSVKGFSHTYQWRP